MIFVHLKDETFKESSDFLIIRWLDWIIKHVADLNDINLLP